MDFQELIKFLLWAEQVQRPRMRLCEQQTVRDGDLDIEHTPIFQTIGWDGKLLGNDAPGQEGIRALIEMYNDWTVRLAVGKATPLTAEVEARLLIDA